MDGWMDGRNFALNEDTFQNEII